METDDEEQDDFNRVNELEEALETVNEVQNPVVLTNTDESSCDKLLTLHSPKVSVSRTSVKHAHLKQMGLLKKWILQD